MTRGLQVKQLVKANAGQARGIAAKIGLGLTSGMLCECPTGPTETDAGFKALGPSQS
jgi:hypothetical protein